MDQQRPQFFVTPLMEVSAFSYLWIRAGLLTWETFNILSRNKFHQIHKFMQYLLFHGTADNGVTIFYRYLNGSSFPQLPKITFWQNFLPSPGHLKALPAATCYQIPKPMPHIYFLSWLYTPSSTNSVSTIYCCMEQTTLKPGTLK